MGMPVRSIPLSCAHLSASNFVADVKDIASAGHRALWCADSSKRSETSLSD